MAEASAKDTAPETAALDEAKLAKALSVGLPIVTVTIALVVGVLTSLATALLVLIGGVLLGTIAIFWASLRVLSGDAPLAPELEALDRSAYGVDALASRRKMLVRALKDLENERAVGKLEDADYEQIAGTYREELKEVLRRIDATLEPHRAKAEELARAYLVKAGLAEGSYRGEAPADERDEDSASKTATEPEAARRVCPKCEASNEPDAKFCKECATSLLASPGASKTEKAEETTDEA